MSRMRPTVLTLFAVLLVGRGLSAEENAHDLPPLPAPFSANAFKQHVVFLSSDELKGRDVGSEGWSKAAQYLIRHLQKAGLRPLMNNGSWFQEFSLNADDEKVPAKNILAVWPGRGDLKDQAVIVTAHLDHLGVRHDAKPGEDAIFNGADDNASGVSALLLIAQAVGEQNGSLPDSRRTVIFASFAAEERGLFGARQYVEHPAWPLDRTAAVINFDAMGRLRMGKVFASDAETNSVLAKAAAEAAKSRGLVAETRFGGHGRSDHAVFIDRGIPGMQFFTGANSDYHQVTDQWERLNMQGGATIAWIGWRVLQTAIAYPDRLEFEKTNPLFDMQFVLNLVKTMGIVPALGAQEGHYPQILFVIPGTPAAKYGLQGGDQLAGINGLRFQRVEDALTIFSQLTFDEGLRLAILRNGKETEVRIPASFFQEMSGPKATLLDSGLYEVQFRDQPPAGVTTVFLAGEFNQWQPTALRMQGPDADGWFTARLELKAGVYEYKFVHDGKEWVADPRNLYQVGRVGNSVLWVGKERK